MILGLFIGISIGIALSAVWRLFLKLLFTAKNMPEMIEKEPEIRIGPFLHKKPKNKKVPKSHSDSEVWEREMRDSGRML